jgi:hypothetical protein
MNPTFTKSNFLHGNQLRHLLLFLLSFSLPHLASNWTYPLFMRPSDAAFREMKPFNFGSATHCECVDFLGFWLGGLNGWLFWGYRRRGKTQVRTGLRRGVALAVWAIMGVGRGFLRNLMACMDLCLVG